MKIYQALLSDNNDSGNLEVRVVRNDFAASIVWTRQIAGQFIGVLKGAFPEGKTFVLSSVGQNQVVWLTAYRNDNDSILLLVANPQESPPRLIDGLMWDCGVEITVY